MVGNLMFTLFAVPRAFEGRYGIEQHNAIASWKRLEPEPEVILFYDDDGTAEAAKRHGCVYVPNVNRSENGTPYVDEVFHRAQEVARHDVLVSITCDVILMQDFAKALEACALQFPQFCMVGQRLDVDLHWPLQFEPGWQEWLADWARGEGRYYTPAGTDYIGFRRGLYKNVPPFLYARSSWDNWLMAHPLALGVPLVNATEAVCAVHQEVPTGKVSEAVTKLPAHGWEIRQNRRLLAHTYGTKAGRTGHATHRVTAAGRVKAT